MKMFKDCVDIHYYRVLSNQERTEGDCYAIMNTSDYCTYMSRRCMPVHAAPAACIAHVNAHHWNTVWQRTRERLCGHRERLCACMNAAGWRRADDGQSRTWHSEVSISGVSCLYMVAERGYRDAYIERSSDI